MTKPQIGFDIGLAQPLAVSDGEIAELLAQVYVDGGFTTRDEAASLFDPAAVRARGVLIGAREKQHSHLAGMIIVVPPDSPACRRAKENEAELHLLGVRPEYRRHGLGRALVDTAIAYALHQACSKLILWTQMPMTAAQRLYASAGFVHMENFERNGRTFKVYERSL